MDMTINGKPAYLLKAIERENHKIFEESLVVKDLCSGMLEQINDSFINKYRYEIEFAALYRNLGLLITGTDPNGEIYKLHPKLSASALEHFGYSGPIRKIVSQHHERIDGTGYYNQLEEDILEASKILITADAFIGLMYDNDINNVAILEEKFKDSKCTETTLDIMKSTGKHKEEYIILLENHLKKEGFLK